LNDKFRITHSGNGVLSVMASVQNRADEFREAAIEAALAAENFAGENEPWHVRDYGTVVVENEKFLWKIEDYDNNMQRASVDPADETQTKRVLIIMLASGY